MGYFALLSMTLEKILADAPLFLGMTVGVHPFVILPRRS